MHTEWQPSAYDNSPCSIEDVPCRKAQCVQAPGSLMHPQRSKQFITRRVEDPETESSCKNRVRGLTQIT